MAASVQRRYRGHVERWTLVFVLAVCGCSDDAGDTRRLDGGAPDAAAVVDAGAEGWGNVDDATASGMQDQLDDAVTELGLIGAAFGLAYTDERQLWSGAAGHARREDAELWTPGRSVRVGSITKTFTAAAILQLVEEDSLSLDDPLEAWVAGYYDGLGVTVRHLMTNTSGIASYNYVGSFDDGRPWIPAELVAWAVAHEPELRFEPGSAWEYSNTNWVLLGLAIEAVTGRSYEEEIQRRFLDPLALRDTYVAASGDANPAIVDCYDAAGENVTGRVDPSFGWAAGAMVSTPADLARWGAELYGGRLLSAESMELMLTPATLNDGSPVPDYGMGAFIEDDGTNAIYGHTGGIGGYLTYLYFWRADRIALVVSVNQMETDLRELAGYGWTTPLGL